MKHNFTKDFIATLAKNGIHKSDSDFIKKGEAFHTSIIKAEVAADEAMYGASTYESFQSEWELRGSNNGE